MAEAMVAEKYFTADTALRYKYEQREKFLRDQRSPQAQAEEKGRAKGKAEDVKAMKADGLPIEKIMQYTGLTAEQIEAI